MNKSTARAVANLLFIGNLDYLCSDEKSELFRHARDLGLKTTKVTWDIRYSNTVL